MSRLCWIWRPGTFSLLIENSHTAIHSSYTTRDTDAKNDKNITSLLQHAYERYTTLVFDVLGIKIKISDPTIIMSTDVGNNTHRRFRSSALHGNGIISILCGRIEKIPTTVWANNPTLRDISSVGVAGSGLSTVRAFYG